MDVFLPPVKKNSHLGLNTEITFSEVKEMLSQSGLKATHPRIVVLADLIKHEEHPTAERIHSRIREQNPSISLGSVYRILDKMVEVDIVKRVSSKSGLKRYDANLHPHSHIYCSKTESIQDFEDEELQKLIWDYLSKKTLKNFSIKDIKLQINGEKDDPNQPVNIV